MGEGGLLCPLATGLPYPVAYRKPRFNHSFFFLMMQSGFYTAIRAFFVFSSPAWGIALAKRNTKVFIYYSGVLRFSKIHS